MKLSLVLFETHGHPPLLGSVSIRAHCHATAAFSDINKYKFTALERSRRCRQAYSSSSISLQALTARAHIPFILCILPAYPLALESITKFSLTLVHRALQFCIPGAAIRSIWDAGGGQLFFTWARSPGAFVMSFVRVMTQIHYLVWCRPSNMHSERLVTKLKNFQKFNGQTAKVTGPFGILKLLVSDRSKRWS